LEASRWARSSKNETPSFGHVVIRPRKASRASRQNTRSVDQVAQPGRKKLQWSIQYERLRRPCFLRRRRKPNEVVTPPNERRARTLVLSIRWLNLVGKSSSGAFGAKDFRGYSDREPHTPCFLRRRRKPNEVVTPPSGLLVSPSGLGLCLCRLRSRCHRTGPDRGPRPGDWFLRG